MQKLGARTAHYWKLQHMLRATGTDAVSAFDDGALSSEDWAAMVERCRGCQWVRGCRAFVGQQAQKGTVACAPAPCRNHAKLNRLRAAYPEVA